MADAPGGITAKPDNPLQTESNDRLAEARKKKNYDLLDYKETYFLSAPRRQRQLTSGGDQARLKDAPELNTDLGFLLCGDFVTEIVNTYMPEAQMWCERGPGMFVPNEAFEAVAAQVKEDDKAIFGAIKSSNLYAELPKAFNPDLAIAGAGLYVHRPHAHAAIEVLAVPMSEMEINLGPNGEIDDRFIVRKTRNCYVRKLIGEEAWPKVSAEVKKEITDKPAGETEVRWGWWRKWDDVSDEVWQHVIMIKDHLVDDKELKGEGCCAFLVMRFNPSADWPWATGPLLQGLPTLRQVDEWERQIPEACERIINGPITYPDDSFAAVEQGLENGFAYPIRVGTEDAVKRIYDQPSIEPGLVDLERKEHRLKKLFYVDHPEQTGDTPPTLGQWLDELARMQRRIGTAGYSFWREGPRAIFLRFKYLLETAGTIGKLQDKQGRMISTMPYNPTQRAAEQQEIATAVQGASILAQMFPEEWRVWMDGKSTIDAFITKMRVSGLLKMRDEKEVEMAMKRIAPLLGQAGLRQQAGAEPAEGAGAPAAAV